MGFRISSRVNSQIPKLAWLAEVDRQTGHIDTVLGSSVERTPDWIVEGVWDDDFESGEFHKSEFFFGSGIRVDADRVFFVPSSATLDRLLYCEHEERVWVSNSLVMLLAATGARLDDNHDYHEESESIKRGVEDYQRRFVVRHPTIECFHQIFFENIVVSRDGIEFQKRSRPHRLDSFEQYYELLLEILARIKDNWQSPARAHPMQAFTTFSSGYDSPAVSALAKSLGVKSGFTGNRLQSTIFSRFVRRDGNDDGTPVAKSLGLEVHRLMGDRGAVAENELYFLATNRSVHPRVSGLYQMALAEMAAHIERNCEAAVVFTGFQGGKVWTAKGPEHLVNDQMMRTDISGFSLTEVRLKAGFINLAAPFILARNRPDLKRIAASPEMAPWRLDVEYDRPIARRIVEDAGVDRQLFGMRKRHISKRTAWPEDSGLRTEFLAYLERRYGRDPRSVSVGYYKTILKRLAGRVLGKDPFAPIPDLDRIGFLMWIWAAEKLARETSAVLATEEPATFK